MIWADARLIAYQSGLVLFEAANGVLYLWRYDLKGTVSP